jgi:Ca2+-binding RTX toxin-like protein
MFFLELSFLEHKCPVVPKFLAATETEKNSMATNDSSIKVNVTLGHWSKNGDIWVPGTTYVTGTDADETLYGFAGNDLLQGNAGNDIMYGNRGNDTLRGGLGDDTLYGGADSDLFIVEFGTDTIKDLGKGGDNMVIAVGTTVNAEVVENWTATHHTRNKGTANIFAQGHVVDASKAEVAEGNLGFNISNAGVSHGSYLTGSGMNDTLTGGNGRDFLRGGAGDDILDGGAGENILTGGAGSDIFSLQAGSNWIDDLGFGGDSLNVGYYGRVQAVLADHWSAKVYSSNDGNAILYANNHNVDVSLAQGIRGWFVSNDFNNDAVLLTGSTHNDTLTGGNGADIITGNAGDDVLTGGYGADVFVFGSLSWGHDTITDFAMGEDKLNLGLSHEELGARFSDGKMTFTDNGEDMVITMENGDSITLQGWHGVTFSDILFA